MIVHAGHLLASEAPVVLAGDFNVVPTNADIYNWWPWQFDAVLQPEIRAAYARLLSQGWVDATRPIYPAERICTFWVNDEAFRRNKGFRMDFLLLSPSLSTKLAATGWTRSTGGASSRVTTLRSGSRSNEPLGGKVGWTSHVRSRPDSLRALATQSSVEWRLRRLHPGSSARARRGKGSDSRAGSPACSHRLGLRRTRGRSAAVL